MDPQLIREIQQYLRALSFRDERLHPLPIDGIYGEQTADAVRAFQLISGLPVTGEVDHETWERLFGAYTDLTNTDIVPAEVFPHPVSRILPNEESALVAFIQLMLREVAKIYGNVDTVPLSGIYDAATVAQIRNLQELHALEANGIIDLQTWNILARLFNDRFAAAQRL